MTCQAFQLPRSPTRAFNRFKGLPWRFLFLDRRRLLGHGEIEFHKTRLWQFVQIDWLTIEPDSEKMIPALSLILSYDRWGGFWTRVRLYGLKPSFVVGIYPGDVTEGFEFSANLIRRPIRFKPMQELS